MPLKVLALNDHGLQRVELDLLLGIIAASVFSSAGSCYARWITGTQHCDELFARLQSADSISPLTALRDQAYLWVAHLQGIVPQGGRHLSVRTYTSSERRLPRLRSTSEIGPSA
jgi:hypothetical protein